MKDPMHALFGSPVSAETLSFQEKQDLWVRIMQEVKNRNTHASPLGAFRWNLQAVMPYLAGATAVVIAVAGAGATIATTAAQSLPGERFHSFKVEVTEPIMKAVGKAPSGAGFSAWQVERRLSEAVELQREHGINPEAAEVLAGYVHTNVEEAATHIMELTKAESASEALALQNKLESAIFVHRNVIELIQPIQEHIEAPVIPSVWEQTLDRAEVTLEHAKEEALRAVVQLPPEELRMEVARQQEKAETSILHLRESVSEKASNTISFQTELERSMEQLEASKAWREVGEYAEAFISANAADLGAQIEEQYAQLRESLQGTHALDGVITAAAENPITPSASAPEDAQQHSASSSVATDPEGSTSAPQLKK